MDSITLDFSDASFNVNEENTFIIEDDGMIYMSEGGEAPIGDVGVLMIETDNNSTVIGAAAITVPQSFGEIFEFEFDELLMSTRCGLVWHQWGGDSKGCRRSDAQPHGWRAV